MMSYLLRRVSKPNKDLLSQALLADFLALAEHETGNHVAQVLIKVLVKDEEKSQMVLDLVKPNVDKLLASKKGNYIGKSPGSSSVSVVKANLHRPLCWKISFFGGGFVWGRS